MFSYSTEGESRQPKAFVHKIADYAGGVNVKATELGGDILVAGTPISAPDANGQAHVVKTAVLTASATSDATTLTVAKGHHFKVGDVVFAKSNGKAYAITTIATNSDDANSDDITIGTTLGVVLSVGDVIAEAASAGSSGAKLKYSPIGLLGDSYGKAAATNHFVNVWIFAVAKKSLCPPIHALVSDALKTVSFI